MCEQASGPVPPFHPLPLCCINSGCQLALTMEANRLAHIGPATRQVLVTAISVDLVAVHKVSLFLPQCLYYSQALT